MGDLPLLCPLPPAWALRNAARIASLRPEIQPIARTHVDACWREGLAVVLLPPVRTDADQLVLYRQGREMIRGVWHVTAPGAVVTSARTSDQSPHGACWRAAYDVAFLVGGVLVSPKSGPDNDSWDGDFVRVGEIGEAAGLEWGGRWRTRDLPRGDLPHFQAPRWRDLPRLP